MIQPVTTELTSAVRIKKKAGELGFDLCGIAPADPSAYRDYYLRWISGGYHGQMDYLARRIEEKLDPRVYFPPARSVICLALNYHHQDKDASTTDSTSSSLRPGKIARYARGTDYHIYVKNRLHRLADWIRETFPGALTKVCVDTAPVMERELAVRAGIGWQGKNTCVISPRIGSWIFLAEILTDLELPFDTPEPDHCGSCTRCLEACPTGALFAPYQMDATRCISYLTIEHRDPIDPSFHDKLDGWIFGCDICQEVCPFNRKAPSSQDPDVRPRVPATVELEKVLEWTPDDYRQLTRHTAMKRVKLPLFQRNAQLLLEQS
ncbi:MAG: epoxyqueuosine reductase [Phycisphaerae bacterium]|jgi:epoxyqueuosine reductase|nr:MAG: epoxyqueuosine reductase [Phycisphaerae bacterium]